MDVDHFISSKFVTTPLKYYYPFGNTPAEDLLEHVPDSRKNPSVLQLGCGDIRSCFYTLWKNFDESHHGNFEGVTFHLNDYCAAVLARNVLFLYWTLMLADIPEKDTHRTKQMISSIWNIWFCHELQRHDVNLLRESLTKLLEVFRSNEQWARPTNPLRGLIEFVDEFKQDTTQAIYKIYTVWLEDSNTEMNAVLKQCRAYQVERVKEKISFYFLANFGIYSFAGNSRVMMDEYSNYLETGNAFAEQAFGMPLATGTNSVLNPTFYRNANQFILHYTSMPYECFVHSHLMTKKNISFPPKTLLVQQEKFEKFPLLANSLQQFSMWLISAAKYLSNRDRRLSTKFLFYYSDAISTAVRLRCIRSHCFDVIHSSNLIDHLTSFTLVINTITLLREPNGLLLTTAMKWSPIEHKTINNYLEATLNFKLEHLLSLFGIRCFGQEGLFAGDGILHAIPCFRPAFEASAKIRLPRILIWKSTNATPLVLQSLNEQSLTTEILFDCIKGATLGFLSLKSLATDTAISAATMNSHSALTALSIFLNRLSSESLKSVKGFEFWDGLCSRLRNDPDMQLFLMHLQCQAILMNIHMHLITTPIDCPICNDTIAEYFLKMSVPFNASICDIKVNVFSLPVALACIHPNKFDTKSFNIRNPCTAGSNGVYLLDSSICSVSEMKCSSIHIVIPRNMIDFDEYSVTLFDYNYSMMEEKYIGVPLSTVSLKNIDKVTYPSIINSDYSLSLNPSSSFGKLTLKEYTGGRYNANISLSEKVISDLQGGYKLRSEIITDTSLKIICNTSEFILEYSIPIDYNNVKIKYSTKRKLAMIEADCKPFDTYTKNQIPLFFVNPENRIILPQTNISELHLHRSGSSQLTIEDRNFIDKYGRDCSILPPSINAKELFITLFQRIHHPYFRLVSATEGDRLTYGIIVVHNRLFDVQYQTPALDLSFYINEDCIDKNSDPAFYSWSLMRLASNFDDEISILVNGNEVSLVKQVLIQFSNRTRTTKKAFNPLINFGMDKYFRRAIVYHLSSDVCELPLEDFPKPIPQLQMTGQGINRSTIKPALPVQVMCSRCKSQSNDLKKCTRCRLVAYCGKQCQREDWSEHKLICKQT